MNTSRTRRKWEVFPGKNRFFCNGRIVTSNQQSVFLLTLFLIVGVTTLFFVFDSPYLTNRLSIAIPIVEAVVFFFLMLFFFRTSWTDPGILPRATPEEAVYNERQIDRLILNEPYQPPRTLEVVINGVVTKLKYCATCKIFRPPRASHCSVCDNCVERFDHHCPWVGNCIGKRNYRYFYWFLVLVTIDCCYILAFSVTTLVLRSIESDFVNALRGSPGSIIEAVVTFVALWSVVGLTGFHTFLASCNITTNEDIKNLYSKSGQKNPFSHSSAVKNYFDIICGPLQPSLIDRRGLHMEDSPSNRPVITYQDPGGVDDRAFRPGQTFKDNRPGLQLQAHIPRTGPSRSPKVEVVDPGMTLHNNKMYPDVVNTTDLSSISIRRLGDA